jgi:kojibiose phosphorylase/nigerose phosphorylase
VITIEAERFASMEKKHLLTMDYSFFVNTPGEIRVITGIDGDVWDINGPHFDTLNKEYDSVGDTISIEGITHENKDKVIVSEKILIVQDYIQEIKEEGNQIFRNLSFKVVPGITYHLYKYITVFTSKDSDSYRVDSLSLLNEAYDLGYASLKQEHYDKWEDIWRVSEVLIEGDDEAMEALNYSLYHLHCIAPRHSDSLSIAARGLSGQTYKGAVFWDTEMFMLDFFLFTDPKDAKTLLKYRIDTLEGAKKKAKSYGLDGAFYAWESQEGGYDACSDYNVTDVFTGRPMRTFFKDKQIHISAAIAYGIMRYIDFTGEQDLLEEGGIEALIECGKFYYSLLVKKVHLDRYELHDVIGPDEYHERVNNNAYTNRMAKYTFDSAIKVLEIALGSESLSDVLKNKSYDLEQLITLFKDASDKLYIPNPDKVTKVIEQFDDYEELEEVSVDEVKKRLLHDKEYWGGAYGVASHTKVIKQADVVTMMNLFSKEYSNEELLANWEYYEPRTEHGSSLSACMYSMLACKCQMPEKAYPFFLKSAKADLKEGGKQWAGLIYIGGTHPAASGGAYMTAIEGFAGVSISEGELTAKAALPKGWKLLQFRMYYKNELYEIQVREDQTRIKKI